MFGELDVPSIERAKRRVKRRNSIFIIFASLFVLIIFFLIYLYILTSLNLSWQQITRWIIYTLITFAILKYLFNYVLDFVIDRWETLRKKDLDEKIGGFEVKTILEYTDKISDDLNIKGSRVEICTLDSTLPNAFGLLWKNIICLDKSWLRLLDEKELQALISHELYHLKLRKTRPAFGHPYLMKFVMMVEISFIVGLITFYGFFAFYDILIFLILFQWVNSMFLIAPMRASRAEEHLCDWSAVKYTGIEGPINLMLKMGQRYEAVNIIQEAVKEQTEGYNVPTRDYIEIQKEIDKRLTREDMHEEGIKQVVKETVDKLSEKHNWKKSSVSISFPSLGLDKLNRATRKHKIDWLEYDNHIQDFKLDKTEITNFVEDVKSNQKSFLFDAPIDSHKDAHGTHPTIKQRVLFLWKNYNQYTA